MQPNQTTNPAEMARLYNEYVLAPDRGTRPEAYLERLARLGIDGNQPEAITARLERGRAVLDEDNRRSDLAYNTATWPEEPFLPDVSIVGAVVEAGGDLRNLTIGQITSAATSALNANGYETVINDEDGPHYEWVSPMDDPAVVADVYYTAREVERRLKHDPTEAGGHDPAITTARRAQSSPADHETIGANPKRWPPAPHQDTTTPTNVEPTRNNSGTYAPYVPKRSTTQPQTPPPNSTTRTDRSPRR